MDRVIEDRRQADDVIAGVNRRGVGVVLTNQVIVAVIAALAKEELQVIMLLACQPHITHHTTRRPIGDTRVIQGVVDGLTRIAVIKPPYLGAAVMQHDARGRFDAPLTLSLLEKHGATGFCAPPTAYRMLVLEDLSKYNLDNLRRCTGAGEPLNPEVMKQWEDGTGHVIYDGYGQTETVILVGNFRCNEVRPGSMGLPAPGFTIGVVDEEGNEVPAGEEG